MNACFALLSDVGCSTLQVTIQAPVVRHGHACGTPGHTSASALTLHGGVGGGWLHSIGSFDDVTLALQTGLPLRRSAALQALAEQAAGLLRQPPADVQEWAQRLARQMAEVDD
jgi:hypothetical protein